MKMRKQYFALLPALLLLLLAFAPASPALAADGVNGEIDIDLTTVVENTLLSVRFYELDVSSDYTVNWTSDATGYFFTTGASQTEQSIPIRVTLPATGHAFSIELWAGALVSEIDAHAFYVSPYSDYLDEDQFIDLGIPILVIVIFAGIIVTLIAGFKFRG